VIALADGAGSAKLSHFGAECVVDTVTGLFVADFDELYSTEDGRQVKVSIIEKTLAAVNAKADELDCTPKDLAATMLVVAVKDDRFIIAHIGDGVIGYLDGETLKVASAPANGEHANETYFVTSSDAISTMQLFKGGIKDKAGFIIMSDGTEQSLYNKRENTLSRAVIKLMQHNVILDEETMCSRLESTFENVIAKNTHDDCSVALLCRENSILRAFADFNTDERCEMYGIKNNDRNERKRIARYDVILELLKVPLSCKAVSKKIHLKPAYTARHLKHLCSVGLVKCTDGMYQVP